MEARARRRVHARTETGASLVEVLVALAILSIAAVAILAGLQLSITTSDIQRKQTSSSTYVRNYAEAVEAWVRDNGLPADCAAGFTAAAVGYTDLDSLPYTPAVEDVSAVAADGTAAGGSCDATGLARVTIQVRSDDGAAPADSRATERLTFVVREP